MSAPRPRVLLFSNWQTINIGDVGHTFGALAYFERYWPEADVTVWLAKTNPAVDAALRARFPSVPHVSGGLHHDAVASTPELQAAFDGCDVFVMNSGMHFNRFWGCPTNLLDACTLRAKPFCLYGQSFDGYPKGLENTLPARLSETALITTRDSLSLEFLRSIGVQPRAGLRWGPDGCFGIDVRDDAAALPFLEQHGLEPRKFITVTIRTNTPKLGATSGDPLNPLRPTPEQEAQDERWAATLRAVIEDWVRSTGWKVLLAPEVDKEIEPARRLLLERLPADVAAAVVWRDTFWNVDEAASVYARAHTVVSMEPHSCIIALASGTPILHLYSPIHGIKAAMFADLGAPEWLIDIDATPATTSVAALRAITEDHDAALNKAVALKAKADADSAEIIGQLRALAEERK